MTANAMVAKVNTVRDLLAKSTDQIAMALPRHMNADRLARIAMTTIQRTPKLLECDPKGLVGNIIECAQLGLEPDGILGSAYLVPFNNPKKGRVDCQLIVGYKGLIDLARRSGRVRSIFSKIVYVGDEFQISYGLEPDILHVPAPFGDRGGIYGVYAAAVLNDGDKAFEFLFKEEVDAIKKSSRAGSSGPWATHWEEMAKKTAIRRLAKTLPLSPEFQRAAAVDELQEVGIATSHLLPVETAPPAISETVKPAPAEETPPEETPENAPEEEAPSPLGLFRYLLGEYCKGDVAEMENLSVEMTMFRGKGLHLKELASASAGRIQSAVDKLKGRMEEDRKFSEG